MSRQGFTNTGQPDAGSDKGEIMNEQVVQEKGVWIRGSLIGALINAGFGYGVTFFIVGMPSDSVQNAVNNAISGGISALIAGLVGTFMYLKKTRK